MILHNDAFSSFTGSLWRSSTVYRRIPSTPGRQMPSCYEVIVVSLNKRLVIIPVALDALTLTQHHPNELQ